MRTNVFQKLIQQWDAVHPYNAAQWMRVRMPLDFDAMNRAWIETVRELQIGAIPTTARRIQAADTTALDNDLPKMVEHVEAERPLDEYLSDELNRPFEAGSTFRPFVTRVDGRLHSECIIGLVYQHWAADSVSVRAVLREWYLRLCEPASRRTTPMPTATAGYFRRFGPLAGKQWNLISSFWSSMTWAAKMKSCRRLETRDKSNLHCRFTFHSLPRGVVPKLLRASRSRDATLNDLFLAVMAQICDRHVASAPTDRRRRLALGTIVDLRGREPQSVPSTPREEFGMYLGFTSVICREGDLSNFDALLRSISKQNREAKASQADRASMIRIASAVLVGKLFRNGDKLVEWYRKRVPFVAGISNVNLNKTWVAAKHPQTVAQYVRVSPIGPMLPIVFTPSTLGDDLNFGLTWRDSVVSTATAQLIADQFIAALVELAESGESQHNQPMPQSPQRPLRLAQGA